MKGWRGMVWQRESQQPMQRGPHRRARGVLLLSAAVTVVVVVIVALLVSHRPPAKMSADYARDWCASADQVPGDIWIPLSSGTADEVASKISGGTLGMVESRYGDLVLAPPVLVHPLEARHGQDADVCPHWIASAVSPSTHRNVLFDYVYDYPHHRMRWSNTGIGGPGDATFGKTFPYMSLATATRLLHDQRGVGPMAGQEPLLMFFFLPPPPNCTGACVDWHVGGGGGDDPGNAIWLLIGSEGVAYFVGANGHVYTRGDLPIA